jgi:hypothetical protein
MKRSRALLLVVTTLALSAPIVAWATFKPIRIVAPALNGVTCFETVCVEDITTLTIASQLYESAMSNVAVKLRPLNSPPLTVFCSTHACYESFGGRGRGITVFNLGVVLPATSWQPYIVEHEFIHMLQAQELGLLGRERTPLWFKEGMPFFISAPPASDLPEYAKPLVDQYAEWERRVGRENVWAEISRQ